MTIAEITADPMIASVSVTLPNGLELEVRPLIISDQEAFGEFLSGLSSATNQLYQPHPLTKEAARDMCENLDYTSQLPFVTVTNEGKIVAYFLFDFRPSTPEINRYKQYGMDIDSTKDCRFAPVVADAYQGQGLGKVIFQSILPILRRLPLRSLILSGGTQEGNKQAINFYEKTALG